jgi:hypothetical protein
MNQANVKKNVETQKKMRWSKPELERLGGTPSTKGDCGNGSSDRGLCSPFGSMAGSGCGVGADGF